MNEMTTAAGRLLPCGDSADARYCETFWAQNAELEQLRAELDGERRQRLQLAGERDEARSDLRRMHELVTEILGRFGPSGSGHTARVGQVQIGKWAGLAERISARHAVSGVTADGAQHPGGTA